MAFRNLRTAPHAVETFRYLQVVENDVKESLLNSLFEKKKKNTERSKDEAKTLTLLVIFRSKEYIQTRNNPSKKTNMVRECPKSMGQSVNKLESGPSMLE